MSSADKDKLTVPQMRGHVEPMTMEADEYETFRNDLFTAMWRDLDPLENQIEDNEELPLKELIPLLRKMRAFGLTIPSEYGGVGLTVPQYLPIIAEFAKLQGGIRVLVHVHNNMSHALWELGNDEQRRELLPELAEGRKSVAFGLTEPDYGTGAGMGTTAVHDGDGYLISGRKWLITNSDVASHFMIFARTLINGNDHGISTFMVERGAEGFEREPLPETMGCKGGEHGLLTLTNVRVPADAVLGNVGDGLSQMEQHLEISRLFIAATSLGTAERAFELSIEQSKNRVTFGKPISERQAVQRYLAEMAVDLYALRNMIRDAGEKWNRGQRIPAEASMCKLFGLEAVGRVTDRALLVYGGIGYTRLSKIERLYRDARLNWLEEGTPSIQQMVIARQFLNGYRPELAVPASTAIASTA
jgi:alkylation response protein AidB-like acyl-CoA dehydrogenase